MRQLFGVERLVRIVGCGNPSIRQEISSTLFICHHLKRQYTMAMQNLHIGQLIKAVFDQSGLSVAEFARRIHTARSNVYFIFERPSIDILQLLNICEALNYNFLDDIQIQRGMKSKLCPREIHIDLNLDDLSDEKAVQVGRFLEDLKKEKRP